MSSVLGFIPNLLTLLNAFSGALAVLFFANDELVTGAYLILIGAIFDFFDGLVARALGVSSDIGKDLDSLADMLTFGLAPAFLAHKLLLISVGAFAEEFDPQLYIQYIPFIAVMFTGYRLAKFNHDQRQGFCFYGLASPAHAMFWISIPLMIHYSDQSFVFHWFFETFNKDLSSIIFQPQLLIACSVLLSVMMVIDIPLFAMKFDGFQWKGNELKFSFIILSLFLLILLGFAAVPFIMLFYILISTLHYQVFAKKS